jgi:hypothetical protein
MAGASNLSAIIATNTPRRLERVRVAPSKSKMQQAAANSHMDWMIDTVGQQQQQWRLLRQFCIHPQAFIKVLLTRTPAQQTALQGRQRLDPIFASTVATDFMGRIYYFTLASTMYRSRRSTVDFVVLRPLCVCVRLVPLSSQRKWLDYTMFHHRNPGMPN